VLISYISKSFEVKGTASSGAVFSKCGKYRYQLWRMWEGGEPQKLCAFIGLNPSTATEVEDDPTVRRCINYAKAWGFNGMFMLNAYAYRATDPKDMKKQDDPIGDGNDESIVVAGMIADKVICCWGNNCEHSRQADILTALDMADIVPHCLAVTKLGYPAHPLYLKANLKPIRLEAAANANA